MNRFIVAGEIMSDLNPCMSCGACCAFFRVSFYWAEGSDAGGCVPVELTEPVSPFCVVWQEQSKNPAAALPLTERLGIGELQNLSRQTLNLSGIQHFWRSRGNQRGL